MKHSGMSNVLCIFIATLHREQTVQRTKFQKDIRNKVNKEQMFIKQCYSSKQISSEKKLFGFVATWRNNAT